MQDLTAGSEGKALFYFTLPMMGAQLLQAAYSFTDSVIVGNFVGAASLGAVGVSGALIWLLNAIIGGIGNGTNILVAQYAGAERKEDVRQTAATAFWFSLLLGIAVTTLFIGSSRTILCGVLGTPPEMESEVLIYFNVYCAGIVFQMIYNVLYGVLRGLGDSKGAVFFLLVAAIVNLVLDLWFVAGLQWGVAGAAWATVLAQAGSALASALYLFKRYPQFRTVCLKHGFRKEKIILLLRFGIPVAMKSAVSSLGFLLLQRLVNSFGPASIEGFTAMNKTEGLLHIPSLCFSTALSSFTGQNLGAGKLGRIRRGYRQALLQAGGMSVVLTIGMLFFGKYLLGLFAISGDSLLRAHEHLMTIAFFLLLTTIGNVAAGLLQGAGDVKITVVASFANLGVRLLTAFVMTQTAIGFRSIYWSIPLAWLVGMLIPIWRVRSGKWKRNAVV